MFAQKGIENEATTMATGFVTLILAFLAYYFVLRFFVNKA